MLVHISWCRRWLKVHSVIRISFKKWKLEHRFFHKYILTDWVSFLGECHIRVCVWCRKWEKWPFGGCFLFVFLIYKQSWVRRSKLYFFLFLSESSFTSSAVTWGTVFEFVTHLNTNRERLDNFEESYNRLYESYWLHIFGSII